MQFLEWYLLIFTFFMILGHTAALMSNAKAVEIETIKLGAFLRIFVFFIPLAVYLVAKMF